MENDQMTAFDAVSKFGVGYGHIGRLGSLIVDSNACSFCVDVITSKIIDGVEYTSKKEVDLRSVENNEVLQTVDKGNWKFHTVTKLYGKIKIYASFIEDVNN